VRRFQSAEYMCMINAVDASLLEAPMAILCLEWKFGGKLVQRITKNCVFKKSEQGYIVKAVS